MQLANTPNRFGIVSRLFHWATAFVILSAFGLGVVANNLPQGDDAAIAVKAAVFSGHKTVGVLAFLLGIARLGWTVTQPHPHPLNPERRAETFLAALVHWLLYLSLVIVPLSGWVHHGATSGFAPILWPFGQGLPMVAKSQELAEAAGMLHWVFTKVLGLALVLHISGALKHALIDRDATLARMWRGVAAGGAPAKVGLVPVVAAFAFFGLGTMGALLALRAPEQTAAPAITATSGNWQVESGTLSLRVSQMGQEVAGQFGQWQAEILFDPDRDRGNRVTVGVDVTSLTLGSVSAQATGPEFLDVGAHPQARFEAEIERAGESWQAVGVLSLRGFDQPLTLPFDLVLSENTAQMRGSLVLDRRDFGIGTAYGDETTVGFAVTIEVALVARQQ